MTDEKLTIARNHTRSNPCWSARANEKDHKNMHNIYAFYYKKNIELLSKKSIVK